MMPKLNIEMNRDLPEGECVAFGDDPSQHLRLSTLKDQLPSWARTLHVSVEDYGKIMRSVSTEN